MRKHFFVRLFGGLVLVALLLTLTGWLLPNHSAHAASLKPATLSACQKSPNDTNCDGQSSVDTGCGSDGITLTSIAVGTGTLAVRFSPTCLSAWAHATNGSVTVLQACITRINGNLSYCTPFTTGTAAKSPMVYIGGHQAVQACAYVNGTSRCTNLVTY